MPAFAGMTRKRRQAPVWAPLIPSSGSIEGRQELARRPSSIARRCGISRTQAKLAPASNEAGRPGLARRLRPGHDVERLENTADVDLDGLFGEFERQSDFLVGLAALDQPQHLDLTIGQARGSGRLCRLDLRVDG